MKKFLFMVALLAAVVSGSILLLSLMASGSLLGLFNAQLFWVGMYLIFLFFVCTAKVAVELNQIANPKTSQDDSRTN